MAYIAVQKPNGDQGIGSAVHVGEGVFVTARHVVEGCEILEVARTDRAYVPLEGEEAANARVFLQTPDGESQPVHWVSEGILQISKGPFYHSDPGVDIAVFTVTEIDPRTPFIRLGDHLDDWLGQHDFMPSEAIVLGYPPIPLTIEPVLVGARAEVNAMIDRRDVPHVHFVLSSMPRGGFSGGVAVLESGIALGIVTSSLMVDAAPAELGFMTVVGVEPIYGCLADNRLLPDCQAEGWDGFWNSDTVYFGEERKIDEQNYSRRERAMVELFNDGKRSWVAISSESDPSLANRAIEAAVSKLQTLPMEAKDVAPGKSTIHVYDPSADEAVTAAARAASRIFLDAGLVPTMDVEAVFRGR